MLWKNWPCRVICATSIFVVAGLYFTFRPNPGRAKQEQYAVYSAYIEDGLTGESHSLGDRRGIVLIAADASMVAELSTIQRWRFTAASLLNLKSRTDSPRLSLLCGLFLKNLRIQQFDRHFKLSADYELLDSPVLSIPQINERFPRSYGYLTFSSIAFNSDFTDALFYTEHLCGLCGGGEYVLMAKHHGSWAVMNRYGTWVS